MYLFNFIFIIQYKDSLVSILLVYKMEINQDNS